jgi:hypothetical protein
VTGPRVIPKPTTPVLQRGHTLARGLVGAWLFNEVGSTRFIDEPFVIHDYSGYGNHGNATRNSNVTGNTSNALGWVPGPWGYCGLFNGGSFPCAIIIPSSPSLDLSGEEFTLAIRANANSLADSSGLNNLFEWGWNGTSEPVSLRYESNGSVDFSSFSSGGGGWTLTSAAGVIATAAWLHVVAVRSKSRNFTGIYVNGILIASTTFSGATFAPNGNPIIVGGAYINGPIQRGLNGYIDSALVYRRALAPTEVAALYQDQYAMFRDTSLFLKAAANTNASISGAGCSALAGSLAPQDSFTIGGAQAAAQAGSVSAGVAISGAQVAAQAGSVQPAISVPLAGAGCSALAGSISKAISIALSGASASAQAGTVSFSGSINAPITGAQVSASAGSVAETDTIALSGAAVAAQAGQVSFSNALNVPLTGAQANTGAGSLAPAITTKALIGAAAAAQAGAVFSSINLAPLGAAAIGQAGILAETARFSLLGAAAAALAGHVAVSIGAAVLLASARLVRVAGEARLVRPPGESRLVRLGADARTITPGAS